jgi:Ca2+-binding RTX toxin-like protein
MVRQARFIAVVRAFLIGYAVLVVAGCAGVRSEAPKGEEQGRTEAAKQEQGRSPEATASEEARCGGTRTVDLQGSTFITNDVSGCPKGGLLEGTDERDKLDGEDGDDEIRGLGAADELWGGFGSDVIYGGPGDDFLTGSTVNEAGRDKSKDVLHGGPGRDSVNGFGGDDVIYGGDGDDFLDGTFDGGDRDELYCGKGQDQYAADKNDRVSSSCEVKAVMGRA